MLIIEKALFAALDGARLDSLPNAEALRADARALLQGFAAADRFTLAGIRKPEPWAAAALHRVGRRRPAPRPTLQQVAALFGASVATVSVASRTLDDAVPRAVPRAAPGRGARGGRAPSVAATAGPDALYRLKITLRGVRPPVWRRVVVPGSFTLEQLHEVILEAFGWMGYHLFSFEGNDASYTDAETAREMGDGEDARLVRVHQVLTAPRERLEYVYDFGDNWEHNVLLEQIHPPDGRLHATCMDGRGACPPEDCGGPWGYQELLEILADPAHEEHEERREWLCLEPGGAWDVAEFDLPLANRRLRRV